MYRALSGFNCAFANTLFFYSAEVYKKVNFS